jgi:flagellin-like protein
MMKKMWKNRSGVSPVIATILMVAITVVLAAVLYVMVMGFGGQGSTAPTGSFSEKSKVTGGEKLTFAAFSPETAPSALKVVIEKDGAANSATYILTDLSSTSALTPEGSAIPSVYLNYTDLAGNKIINSGDYLTVNCGTGSYTVTVLFASTGDKITESSFSI